jgi:hypothetical protein
MKRLFPLAVCTALTALIGTAHAQSQNMNFTGPAIGVSLSEARNKVEYGGFLAGSESKKSHTVGRLDASYGFDLSPRGRARYRPTTTNETPRSPVAARTGSHAG